MSTVLKTLLLIFILQVEFFFSTALAETQNLSQFLSEFHIEHKHANDWKIKKITEANIEGKRRLSLIAENEHSEQLYISVLNNLTEVDYKNIYKNDFIDVKNLYKNSVTPYADSISNQKVCSSYFLPHEGFLKTKSLQFNTLTVMTTSRLAFGVCHEELIFYDCIMGAAFFDHDKYLKVAIYTTHKKKKIQYDKLKEQLSMFEYKNRSQ